MVSSHLHVSLYPHPHVIEQSGFLPLQPLLSGCQVGPLWEPEGCHRDNFWSSLHWFTGPSLKRVEQKEYLPPLDLRHNTIYHCWSLSCISSEAQLAHSTAGGVKASNKIKHAVFLTLPISMNSNASVVQGNIPELWNLRVLCPWLLKLVLLCTKYF